MANIIDISATPRTAIGGGIKRLRRAGMTPAVVYGKGVENKSLQIDTLTFTRILRGSASDNILVNLDVEGQKQLALVQEVQHDYLKGGILHVDFHAVKEDEEIHASVPVELLGEPAGAKFGGMLELLHHSIEVYCLPRDLPERIQADVSHLKVGEAIHVSELKLPQGVRVKLDGGVVIAIVEEPKVEEAPAPAAAAAPAAGAAPAAAAPAAAAAAAAPAKK